MALTPGRSQPSDLDDDVYSVATNMKGLFFSAKLPRTSKFSFFSHRLAAAALDAMERGIGALGFNPFRRDEPPAEPPGEEEKTPLPPAPAAAVDEVKEMRLAAMGAVFSWICLRPLPYPWRQKSSIGGTSASPSQRWTDAQWMRHEVAV